MSEQKRDTYVIKDTSDHFISKAIAWANKKDSFSFFNGQATNVPYGAFPRFLAAGSTNLLVPDSDDPFGQLNDFYEHHKDWMCGFFCYDLKNRLEDLTSNNPDRIGFPDAYFFIPESLVFFDKNKAEIHSFLSPELIYNEILETPILHEEYRSISPISCDTSQEEYIDIVNSIQSDIEEGDYYELNFCLEYYAEDMVIDPLKIYQNLANISKTPFSVLQKFDGNYIISSSPERFIKKSGNMLVSQPMKGTRPRGSTPEEDRFLKDELRTDEKELAENMMIVDLVRNDLARTCQPGTIKPQELFSVYSFSTVHQMISTIIGEKDETAALLDPIKYAFPMGSMTGAPKIMVMDRIDKYEKSKRGPFSGSSGYITPEGDYDFNVLIRSIFYNQATRSLKFNAGSAITYDAVPESEYQECMLKSKTLFDALTNSFGDQ